MPDEASNGVGARLQPSASYCLTMRLHMPQQGGAFAAGLLARSWMPRGDDRRDRHRSGGIPGGRPDLMVAFVESVHAEAGVRSGGRRGERPGRQRSGLHTPDARSGEIEVTSKRSTGTRDDLSIVYTRVGMGLRRA
jgi:hypothetical protein